MILYTLMPLDTVLEGVDKEYKIDEITIDSVKLLVEPINSRFGKIARLISTDPQDYLDPKFSPGSIFEYKNVK